MYGRTLAYLNKNLGKVFYGNSNTLYFNIFNSLYKKNIANKNINDQEIYEYITKGIVKPKINSDEVSNYLFNKINDKNSSPSWVAPNKDVGFFKSPPIKNFIFDEDMKKKIRKYVNVDLDPLLKKLEKYYNNKIVIAMAKINRIVNLEELLVEQNQNYYSKINREKIYEAYNNYYHADHYTYTHFKFFLNLKDVDETEGPLQGYTIKDTPKFIKYSNYKNRTNYNNVDLDCLIKNKGKLGDLTLANVSECIHRAGIPKKGKHRDILFLHFVATPDKNVKDYFHYENEFNKSIWERDNELSRKFAKPPSLRKMLKLYKNLLNNKLS